MAQKMAEVWAQVIEHIGARSYEEATSLVAELRSRRTRPATAAADVADALLSVKDKEALVDFAKATPAVDASWSDVAILLLCKPEEAPARAIWAELAPKARRLAQGRTFDLQLPKDLGVLWTPDLRPAAQWLGGAPAEEESPEPSATSTPEQRATLLLRASRSSAAAPVDAAKDAKEALSIFRDLNDPVGEATALLAVSHAALDADLQGAQSAANQAVKIFRQLGHQKGLAAATHAAALADKARQNSDDAVFKAGEAKKLAEQLGDRVLEFAACETSAEANITQDRAGLAVDSAKEAQELAVSLNDEGLQAEAQILVARAYGAYEESRGAGLHAAKEALKMYKDKPKGSLKALRALAAASKGNYDEVVSTAQRLAESFSRQGESKEEEVECLLVAADCLQEDVEQAMQLAQAAVKAAKSAPRKTQARALQKLAKLHLQKEEPAEGMRAAMQAANIFRSEPAQTREMRDAEIDCAVMQVQAHSLQGNFDEAFSSGVEHGRRFKDLRNRRGEGCVLMKLVELHRQRLETEKAMKVLQFVPGLFSLAGDRLQEGLAWEQIARIHLEKGQVIQAQKAADECAMNFRKYGSRLYRGRAALLTADVQVNLMSIDKGSPVQLAEAAQEAVQLLRSFDTRQTGFTMALQIYANSQLLSGRSKEAMETARESQEVARKHKQPSAEASALLLEAGAHLQQQDFGESERCAREAKELFKSDFDDSGEASAGEFVSYIMKAEKGEEDPRLFRGFSLRHVSPEVVQQKAEAKQAEKQPRKQRNELQDIYLFQCDPSTNKSDGRVIMTYFDGFEHRAGVGRQQQSKLKSTKDEEEAAAADYSKTFKDTVKQQGYPEKEAAVFAVRWVQATEEKKETSRRGSRELLQREEDRRVVSVKSLGAPSETCGRYAKSERLEAPGERHGYKVY